MCGSQQNINRKHSQSMPHGSMFFKYVPTTRRQRPMFMKLLRAWGGVGVGVNVMKPIP